MKKQILILLVVLTGLNAAAKTPVADTIKAHQDFFSPLHFKNGKAVLTFEAIYCEFYRDGPLVDSKKFPKDFRAYKTLLNERIYSGEAIGFKPKGDTARYNAPYVSNSLFINKIKIGSPVYLTIIVFKNYPGYETQHFFVVKNISLKPAQ